MRNKGIVVCTDDNEVIVDIPSSESNDQRVICKNGYKVIVAGEELEVDKFEPQEAKQPGVNEDIKKRIESLRDVVKVQGNDGNWNASDYMLGYYNGLELALAIIDHKEPVFRELPDVMPEVNEDELVGYIMRTVAEQEDYHNLTYNEVRSVLDAELAFLIEKGIAKVEE